MSRRDDVYSLPPDLPVPADDGAAEHLRGAALPPVSLPSTAGTSVCLAAIMDARVVAYCYPRTGRPDEEPPEGWNAIPGARGCTPQSCAFRDHERELAALGARVFGISTQTTDEQREFAERVHLPFELLSDSRLELATAAGLPTFEVAGMTLIKRTTLIVSRGRIEKVLYPVFPPDENADNVIAWLAANPPARA